MYNTKIIVYDKNIRICTYTYDDSIFRKDNEVNYSVDNISIGFHILL